MNTKKLLQYCYTNADRKLDTATSLLKSKKNSDCLFFCHLALEFLLKGKYVEIKKEMFPMIHDLERLAYGLDLPFSKTQQNLLSTINTFNIAGRYDDYKLSFYKKANDTYTKRYYTKAKELFIWIKKHTVQDK